VTASELLHIINKGNDLGELEYQLLIQLHHEFPYFVLPTILAAKYQNKLSLDSPNELLIHAAIQSPDRKRLKFLIENPIPFLSFLPDQEVSEEKADQSDFEEDENVAKVTFAPPVELMVNEEEESELKTFSKIEEKPDEKSKEPVPTQSTVKKGRRDVLKDLEENLNRLKSTGQEHSSEPADPSFQEPQPQVGESGVLNHELAPDAILAAIKLREKKNLLDEKKQIQDELIDEFNRKTVKFNKEPNGDVLDDTSDLSIESTRLKENLTSESFAKILVKQKKLTEAKEIYRKLQLKFPDKKAYFADCLKQLENN